MSIEVTESLDEWISTAKAIVDHYYPKGKRNYTSICDADIAFINNCDNFPAAPEEETVNERHLPELLILWNLRYEVKQNAQDIKGFNIYSKLFDEEGQRNQVSVETLTNEELIDLENWFGKDSKTLRPQNYSSRTPGLKLPRIKTRIPDKLFEIFMEIIRK